MKQHELMRTGVRYVIGFGMAGNLKYRKDDQQQFGAFDYYQLTGPQQSTVRFHVNHCVFVAEADVYADAQLTIEFDAAGSHKFRDFCKKYLAAIELEGGQAFMRFYDNSLSFSASVEVPLKIVQGGH